MTASTETTNARIRQLKNGKTNEIDDRNLLSVDITTSVRTLYEFGNAGLKPADQSKDTLDGTLRRYVSIVESALKKTGPDFKTPDGLEDTFQAVFLQDSEIQRAVSEILLDVTRQSRLYRFCAVYVPINMDTWIRENLNTPKKTRDTIPFTVASPFDGQYIVEREEGEINFSLYFVPDDEKVLDTHNIVIYECNPRFIRRDTHQSHSTLDMYTYGSRKTETTSISLWSPYWEFIEGRDSFAMATENEKLVDKHRSNYVDYVTPPIPKDLDMNEMTEQQILARGALAVNHVNPTVQANQQNHDVSYGQFMEHIFQKGIQQGFDSAAVPSNPTQNSRMYKRESRIQRLRAGETINRNPHAPLIRDSVELRKQYEMNLGVEVGVPYSHYRMSEKGAYRKDDNLAETEMFAATISNLQEEMESIFYLLYQHTLGIIDETMLDAYRTWERNIAFRPEDIDTLKQIGIGTGEVSDSDVVTVNETGSDRNRASYLVSEISQLTPFDIAMFSYMNSIDVPAENQRHLVSITFLPPQQSATTNLTDYISVYNAGILQEEMIQAIRSRLNIPHAEEEEVVATDPNPRPVKRTRKTKKPVNDRDET